MSSLRAVLPGRPIRLILVDDGSDPPVEPSAVASLRDRLPAVEYLRHPRNRGKGYALRAGVAAATAHHVLFTDIDIPYTPDSMAGIVGHLEGGADVAVGSRDAAYYRAVPPSRAALSRAFRWLMRHTFRLTVTDTQCGLKGFNRRGREELLRTRIDGFLFDLEFIQRVCAAPDLRLDAVPVTVRGGVSLHRLKAKTLLRESMSLVVLALRRPRR